MVIIRLARSGIKKRPSYRIVVADSRYSRDGRFIERIGYFNPIYRNRSVVDMKINHERINYWVNNGAKISKRILSIIKKYKNINIKQT